MTAPACEPNGHCITCSDEAVSMRVLSVSGDAATCEDDAGTRHEGIAVDLVQPVAAGKRILVHAGVAIA